MWTHTQRKLPKNTQKSAQKSTQSCSKKSMQTTKKKEEIPIFWLMIWFFERFYLAEQFEVASRNLFKNKHVYCPG